MSYTRPLSDFIDPRCTPAFAGPWNPGRKGYKWTSQAVGQTVLIPVRGADGKPSFRSELITAEHAVANIYPGEPKYEPFAAWIARQPAPQGVDSLGRPLGQSKEADFTYLFMRYSDAQSLAAEIESQTGLRVEIAPFTFSIEGNWRTLVYQLDPKERQVPLDFYTADGKRIAPAGYFRELKAKDGVGRPGKFVLPQGELVLAKDGSIDSVASFDWIATPSAATVIEYVEMPVDIPAGGRLVIGPPPLMGGEGAIEVLFDGDAPGVPASGSFTEADRAKLNAIYERVVK